MFEEDNPTKSAVSVETLLESILDALKAIKDDVNEMRQYVKHIKDDVNNIERKQGK